jgi:predicted benzoate:H+ symporter BenE
MNPVVSMIGHDPMAVIGFVLIGASAVLAFHLHRKLLEVGLDTSNLFFRVPNTAVWTVPRAYLKARSKHGWSPWPAYAVWLCMVSGIALLIVGLSRLGD